jgi:hypothetical protein
MVHPLDEERLDRETAELNREHGVPVPETDGLSNQEWIDAVESRRHAVWTEIETSSDGTAKTVRCFVDDHVVEEETCSSGIPMEATIVSARMLRRWNGGA